MRPITVFDSTSRHAPNPVKPKSWIWQGLTRFGFGFDWVWLGFGFGFDWIWLGLGFGFDWIWVWLGFGFDLDLTMIPPAKTAVFRRQNSLKPVKSSCSLDAVLFALSNGGVRFHLIFQKVPRFDRVWSKTCIKSKSLHKNVSNLGTFWNIRCNLVPPLDRAKKTASNEHEDLTGFNEFCRRKTAVFAEGIIVKSKSNPNPVKPKPKSKSNPVKPKSKSKSNPNPNPVKPCQIQDLGLTGFGFGACLYEFELNEYPRWHSHSQKHLHPYLCIYIYIYA